VIRHVSVLTFVDGVTDAQVRAIEQALTTLPSHVPELRAYSFGRDLSIDDRNAHFVVVADVDSIGAYRAYRGNPEHQRVLAELIRPVLASRHAVQYQVDDAQ
jgi:hypothetical protein